MSKSIKVTLIASTLLGMYLYGADNIGQQTTNYIDDSRKLTGDIFSSASKGKAVKDKRDSDYDNYLDTVIWNDTFSMRTKNISHEQQQPSAQDNIKVDTPKDKQEALYAAQVKKLEAEESKKRESNATMPNVFAGGYCSLYKTLKISKSYEFSRLDCLLNMGNNHYEKVEVFASFYPDYKREMVIALPLHATLENQQRASFSGIIMNDSKTSVNLSSWSDSKRIQKMMGEGLLVVNDITYNYVSGYMRAKEASRTTSTIDYVSTTNQTGNTALIPVRTTTTKEPEVKDYVIGATVEIFTQLTSIFGKDYLYSQTPLFAVYPQKVYIEGILSFDNQGLAKQFGQIRKDQEKRSIQNNKEWEKAKKRTINRYDNSRTIKTSPVRGVNGGLR